MPLFSSAPKSLCVLRLSAIGDVCNTVAAVQAIQRQWPETEIVWVTGKLEAKLIEDLDNITVVVFDKKDGWSGYKSLWCELKDYRFDALLHMQYAFRASIATLGIKAKYKLGFDATRSQDFQSLFTNVKVPSPQTMHVLDGLLAFGETLGVQDMSPKWRIDYSANDLAWATAQLDTTKPNLVIVPAASKAYKNWTAEGYAKLIQHAHQTGWKIILAGSPAHVELDLATQIENLIDVAVSNLVGKSSLKEMLALLDKANIVVAPDTGPAHMANAVNTPIIGLYAHHNPERTGPYQYRHYVVSAYEEAIQAETGKTSKELSWRARVKDKNAMQRIEAQQVINMFDKVASDLNLPSSTPEVS
ncbi:glycosyltransferase family 9 protein [Vibrio europaeus]|uniref:Glycosyl transferase n=1 Tax=Vibrio europaeus TaxID=300876 RepID=A0A178JBT3_9VIBR|nr:glycosyltransferase family 9 protein [Vibrio europaeus]MDC5703129.1 glycosyltransferase family 9 protein [Vibrio europaeus]MDC5708639.1 glycosyltransferase family 9 protein [Vibrio europaeus]MDC5713021.1 glycosyltransferase family 9 protein [Vibrio europaeus]MDC5718034.1 glycosyltransferase family 9 protein [Vibrio europaeus]MDC5725441.1 glycosyltransferase family 9 protein [Vibrio europaeus]